MSKGTTEGIRNELQKQGGRLAILSAEGGLFDLITGLYNNGNADIDLWLKGYFAEYSDDLRAGASYDARPRKSIGLTVQPITLQSLGSNSKGTRGQVKDRGLLGRFIFGVPISPVGQRAGVKPKDIPDQVEQAYLDGIDTLLKILPEHENTAEGKVYIPVLELTADAKLAYDNFWDEIELRHGSDVNGDSGDRDLKPIQDWTTKTQGSVLRVAGLLHFAKYFQSAPKRPIEVSTMESAIRFYKQAIPLAQAAYALIGDTLAPVNARATELYAFLKNQKISHFKETEIRESTDPSISRLTSKRMPSTAFHQILAALERANVLSPSVEFTGIGGRPASGRLVNPAIYTL